MPYKCIVRPSMEYASPVWCLYDTSDVNCLDAVQDRATHWACGTHIVGGIEIRNSGQSQLIYA